MRAIKDLWPGDGTSETDVSSLFGPYTERRIKLRLDGRLKKISLEEEAERVQQVFRGFAIVDRQLAAARCSPASFAMIGAGSGIEAIGAAQIFRNLGRLTVIDGNAAILDQAAANIRRNIDAQIEFESGCMEIRFHALQAWESHQPVDIIYANLLDIHHTISLEAFGSRGIGCPPVGKTRDDGLLNGYLLARQYYFLRWAWQALTPDGCSLVLLGARFAHGLFDYLAAAAGVWLEVVASGLKRQTDPATVLAAYAAAEKDHIEFDFYDYEKARNDPNVTGDAPGSELSAVLAPWRLSAREALREFRDGASIGHIFHLMKVTRRGWPYDQMLHMAC